MRLIFKRKFFSLLIAIPLVGCDEKSIEEFAFKNTLKYKLNGMCGEDDDCKNAVDSQMQGCLDATDWHGLVKDSENKEKMNKFINEFFPCFKNSEGAPYFKQNQNRRGPVKNITGRSSRQPYAPQLVVHVLRTLLHNQLFHSGLRLNSSVRANKDNWRQVLVCFLIR